MDKSQKNQGQSVIDRSNHDKKAGKDLAGEPEMKELKRMIRSGELDPDRTIEYLEEDETDGNSKGHQ